MAEPRKRYTVHSLNRLAPNNHGPDNNHWGEDGYSDSADSIEQATDLARAIVKALGRDHIVIRDSTQNGRIIWERQALLPSQQLRLAAETLPSPDKAVDGATHVARANSVRQPDAKVGPRGEVAMLESIPAEFTRNTVRIDGESASVWIFWGPLWADKTDVSMAGGIDRLPQWLKRELGPTCLQVDVEAYVDNCAIARAIFTRG
jgi:hypothetical protein